MAAFDVYISYPTSDGYSDFVNITEDVLESSLNNIKQTLEADDFDIGKITFDNLTITLRNEEATYSEASNPTSIFTLTRDQSIIRIDWAINSGGLGCGNISCGETFLSKSRTLFKGLLEENSARFDVNTQNVTFRILGMDSIINKADTPFSSLDVNDDVNTSLFNILNQPTITKFFLVDKANINVKNNIIPDSIAHLEDTTCLEAIQDFLLIGNSIMFVKDDVIYIKQREESAESEFTFYGASSNLGVENIADISGYSIGLSRCWNFWKWEDTNLTASFADSRDRFGVRKKEIHSDLITDTGKITSILNSYLTEFGFPKTELILRVPMYTEIVDLGFLDKINIDYPSEVLPTTDELASKYNQAKYDSGYKYNRVINSLFISVAQDWKILNKVIKPKKQEIEFKIREV